MDLRTDASNPTHLVSSSDTTDLRHWREQLLGGILRAALIVGAIPAVLSMARASQSGEWLHPAVALTALAGLLALERLRQIEYDVRAWCALLVLYGVGAWLLIRVGAVTQIYLLACPTMATLLLSQRVAMIFLALCTATLVGLGLAFGPAHPVAGFDMMSIGTWINLGANFAFVGTLMTLSCAFLLKGLQRSLTRQRAASSLLRSSEDSLRQIAAQVPGMVFRMHLAPDQRQRFVYASPAVVDLFEIEPEALVADSNHLTRLWHPEDRVVIDAAFRRALVQGTPLALECRVLLPGEREKWLHISSTVVSHDAQGAVHNGIMLDITERKASEVLVWQQANFDALTGLPNRRMLHDRLEQTIARSRRDGQPLAVMLIDLDHFKEVNDTLGHGSGDLLLVEAARRIRACTRDSDCVARMGGDEFAVVLAGAAQPSGIEMIARNIIACLECAVQAGR